ncbi:MAG: Phosphoglycerate mutase [Anaerosolibacter sp.]|jgi:2,3-bisphosphoglycerate-dependent phosphoglycerate mutase|uniref:histidine phosphatase family protein n=1 Tax=Anaerosolibacter sp. TaxID=1872527 RepID=UPI002636FB59|nr:histidine phosphatase family protein [Anaerosolibacter sp.]MDF2548932.1 Phosphoglycerate mutase [Anaerosolibacter sp.]
MTTVYFVRHAEPDYTNHNDLERPLTIKGKEDSKLVTDYFSDKGIEIVLSSPYLRAVETVKDFADSFGHTIITVEDFRERKVDSEWIEDFNRFTEQQWSDFDYKLTDGECLHEVQIRNVDALMQVIKEYSDKNIVIGSHGTALSTIINYFEPSFGFNDFQRIRTIMPWIVKFTFQGDELVHIEEIDVFDRTKIRKAVGAIIIKASNKVLLVHKANICNSKDGNIKAASWDFIKGGVKNNETMLDALKREIFEESGIEHFVIKKEFDDKICFEFPYDLRDVIGYDKQETTMFLVQIDEQPDDFRCTDDEIDGYDFVDIDSVSEKLSQEETQGFWNNIMKNINKN